MLRRPHYIALGIVVLVTVAILKLPSRTATKLKLAVSGLYVPLFGAAGSTQKTAEKAGNAVLPRKELRRAARRSAARESATSLARSATAKRWPRKTHVCAACFDCRSSCHGTRNRRRCVARDPANWWRTVRIDRGSRDGVVTNSPVLNVDGLVGRVSEVGLTHSQVVLVGDPELPRVGADRGDARARHYRADEFDAAGQHDCRAGLSVAQQQSSRRVNA